MTNIINIRCKYKIIKQGHVVRIFDVKVENKVTCFIRYKRKRSQAIVTHPKKKVVYIFYEMPILYVKINTRN